MLLSNYALSIGGNVIFLLMIYLAMLGKLIEMNSGLNSSCGI